MKKTLFSVAIIATNFVFGQITLEKTYPSENLQVYTNSTETYYYSVGEDLTTIKIYNADHTLKKEFSPTIPTNYKLIVSNYDNFILSKNIFNSDNLLEIAVIFRNFNTGTSSYSDIIRIYNEDGIIVKDFGDGYYMEDLFNFHVFHDNTTGTNKLRLSKGSYLNQTTEIYNLNTTSLATKEIQSRNKLSAFPIPTNKILNIINPQNGTNKIEVYDTTGKLILNKMFNSSDNKISIDVENLPKGNYFYKVGDLSSKFMKN